MTDVLEINIMNKSFFSLFSICLGSNSHVIGMIGVNITCILIGLFIAFNGAQAGLSCECSPEHKQQLVWDSPLVQ